MNSTLYKLEKQLDILLHHDWETFNELDVMEQLDNVMPILNEFENIVKSYTPINDIFLEEVRSIINSREKQFEKLIIRGKAKHIFYSSIYDGKGGLRILGNLSSRIHTIEYEEMRRKSLLKCNCELALKFHKDPEMSNLKNIAWINDQYYLPEVYSCEICSFKWISYTVDDDLGGIAWEKYSSDDDSYVVYYSKKDSLNNMEEEKEKKETFGGTESIPETSDVYKRMDTSHKILEFLMHTDKEHRKSFQEISGKLQLDRIQIQAECTKLHQNKHIQIEEESYYITLLGLTHFISTTSKTFTKEKIKHKSRILLANVVYGLGFLILIIVVLLYATRILFDSMGM